MKQSTYNKVVVFIGGAFLAGGAKAAGGGSGAGTPVVGTPLGGNLPGTQAEGGVSGGSSSRDCASPQGSRSGSGSATPTRPGMDDEPMDTLPINMVEGVTSAEIPVIQR